MKSFVRIILAVLAVAAVTVASLSVGDGRTHAARGGASEGSPSSDHVVLRPVPSGGPHHDPAADHASQTPKGLPPQSEHAHGRGSGNALVDHKPPPRNPNARHEVETGEGSNGTSTSLMTYHGGAVQTSPNVYLIFWGSSWTGSSGDPYGVANRLHYMYQGLGGSTWANVLKQYGSYYGSFTNPSGQYRGWLRDTSTVPANPSQADVAAVARRAAYTMGDYTYNAQYVVAMPWGTVDQVSSAYNYCAWHNSTVISGSSWVTYTALPYTPYMDALGRGCGGNWLDKTANGRLDGVTINAGHEYAETVNDPGINAWYDADRSENGDKCSWVGVQARTLANGYAFAMQPTWSNQWRTGYNNGCYFS